jgi:multiple sugar transport system ATP-binding protein
MAQVKLSELVKVYPGSGRNPPFEAVKRINLEVRHGEFMVLVGPSGCGKSTTLRMIAGLEEVTAGEIAIDERVVNTTQPKNRDIAMVFQNYALYPHMTVFDNMAFGLKLKKTPKSEIRERVNRAAEILGIEELLERKPKALSGGQRQRVAVGRAIVRNPKVFLFDEPLSNLDAKMRVSMRTEISKLHNRLGATMIYVTHDQVEAMTMGDRICVMKDGKILQVAEPLELYNHPANLFVGGFIGSPPMNFIRGVVEISDGSSFFLSEEGGSRLRLELGNELAAVGRAHAGMPVVLGIRPENIAIAAKVSGALPTQCADASIDVAEPMGSETYLYLLCGHASCIAKVRSGVTYRPGETLRVWFDLDHAHLFDAETEVVLRIEE